MDILFILFFFSLLFIFEASHWLGECHFLWLVCLGVDLDIFMLEWFTESNKRWGHTLEVWIVHMHLLEYVN